MDWGKIIPLVLSSSVVTAIVNNVYAEYKQQSRRNKIDRLLLLDALKRQGVEYINEGKITPKQLQSFVEYYDIYKELGGDGFAEEIRRRVSALPLDN